MQWNNAYAHLLDQGNRTAFNFFYIRFRNIPIRIEASRGSLFSDNFVPLILLGSILDCFIVSNSSESLPRSIALSTCLEIIFFSNLFLLSIYFGTIITFPAFGRAIWAERSKHVLLSFVYFCKSMVASANRKQFQTKLGLPTVFIVQLTPARVSNTISVVRSFHLCSMALQYM